MSSSYQPKTKELAKVRVVSTEHYNKNRSKFKFVGAIGRPLLNFVTTKRNKNTGKSTYVDDTSSLTKKAKGEVVSFFTDRQNKNKDVAYLVVPKQNKTTKRGK